MPAPTTVDVLNATMAATIAGRDINSYTATSTLYTSSSTERHNSIYSNGRIVSTYQYEWSNPGSNGVSHTDYYGQWWVEHSGSSIDPSHGVYYWVEVRVSWYQSTDPAAIGTSEIIRLLTINGADFRIGSTDYGSTLITDAAGSGNDVVDSSATATMGPTLLGKGGDDTLIGNDTHADHIFGGLGNDSLEGRGGDDRLYGQEGNDTINGGAGTDLALYFSAANLFTVTRAGAPDRYTITGPEGTDQLIGIEYIQFEGAAPVAIESLVSQATAGDDVLNGTAGDDTMDGLAGNDTLNGLAGNDTLQGGAGNDTLNGGTGVDTMVGGAGNDIYLVDNAGDVVTEASALPSEIDTVQSSLSLLVRQRGEPDLDRRCGDQRHRQCPGQRPDRQCR